MKKSNFCIAGIVASSLLLNSQVVFAQEAVTEHKEDVSTIEVKKFSQQNFEKLADINRLIMAI